MPKQCLFFILFITFIFSVKAQELSLKITSEDSVSRAVIDTLGYKKTFTAYKDLEEEINDLKKKLIRQGYLELNVGKSEKENDSTFSAQILLGRKTRFATVFFDSSFDANLLKYEDVIMQSDAFRVEISKLEQILKRLNTRISEQGDPFSSVKLTDIKKDRDNNIVADLDIQKTTKRTIDDIIIKGYEKFPKSFIKHVLKLKRKQVFNLNKINTQVQLLNSLGFAERIRDPEVLFTKDTTTLYLYIKKIKNNDFDGFLGFSTDENTSKIKFNGYVNLTLRNNLNYGESLQLTYKSDDIDQTTFDLNAMLPYPFKLPLSIDLGLRLFRKDSTFSNATQYAKINYQIKHQHNIGVGVKTINSSSLLQSGTPILGDYTSNFYQLHYNYKRIQYENKLFPIHFLFDITSSFGSRAQNSTKTNQTEIQLNTFKIFNIDDKNSVYVNAIGNYLVSDNYLDNELYRFGGINSIRGFIENSLSANLYGILNTEYRYVLANNIYAHTIFDMAYTENQINSSENTLFGFGFGFGFLSKSGLFRLIYSNGKNKNQPIDLNDSKVHISLKASF